MFHRPLSRTGRLRSKESCVLYRATVASLELASFLEEEACTVDPVCKVYIPSFWNGTLRVYSIACWVRPSVSMVACLQWRGVPPFPLRVDILHSLFTFLSSLY